MQKLLMAVLATSLLTAMPPKALPHGWYDPDCCSDRDCEQVSNVVFKANDAGAPVMVVTTSFGTKPVTPQTKIRDSKDNRMHACIYGGNLICLYVPPSN